MVKVMVRVVTVVNVKVNIKETDYVLRTGLCGRLDIQLWMLIYCLDNSKH